MRKIIAGAGLTLSLALSAQAANILWWDSTPEFGTQAPDALRQEMSDYVDNLNGGGVFSSTYVSSSGAGAFATHMASNSYDVIVFDSTNNFGGSTFNAADLAAVQSHYSTKSNILLDGTLYIRSIDFNATTDFPGPNGALGGLTVNEINELATRGGGIMIGTDHNCCQGEANEILGAIVPGAAFSGSTFPSTDGVFYGSDLLNSIVPIAANDVFTHWDSVPTEGIAPTGTFGAVTLYSQVDVADDPGGGPKFSYISTSWEPGSGMTDVDDDTPGGDADPNRVPDSGTTAFLLGLCLFAMSGFRKLIA